MKALNVAAFSVGLLGFAAAVTGVSLISPPLALITGGLTGMAWSGFTARAIARGRKVKG